MTAEEIDVREFFRALRNFHVATETLYAYQGYDLIKRTFRVELNL